LKGWRFCEVTDMVKNLEQLKKL